MQDEQRWPAAKNFIVDQDWPCIDVPFLDLEHGLAVRWRRGTALDRVQHSKKESSDGPIEMHCRQSNRENWLHALGTLSLLRARNKPKPVGSVAELHHGWLVEIQYGVVALLLREESPLGPPLVPLETAAVI